MTAVYYLLLDGNQYDISFFELKKELERSIDSCTVNIVKTDISNFDIGDEPALMYWNGSTATELFQGRISDKSEDYEGIIIIEGYGGIINNVMGEEVYKNKSPEYIAQNLIETYTDLTYASTAVSGITISTFVVNSDKLVDAFKYLLDLLTDWIIRSDNDKNFYFEPRTTTYSSETVTINENAYLTSPWNRNPDKIINEVTLVGDVQTFSTDVDSFTAVGGEETVVLSYKPNGNVKILDDGTELTGGVAEGTGTYDYIYDAYTNTITFSVARTAGHTIDITYSYTIPVKVTAQNDSSVEQFGRRGIKITDNNIKTMDDARTWVQNYLDNNSEEDITGEFNVDINRDINVGEILYVTDSFNNINQEFIVNSVVSKFPDGLKSIKVGKTKFDTLKNQKEVNDRLRKLEQQFDNTTLIQLYRNIPENTYITLDQTYVITDRDIDNSFILGHPVNGILGTATGEGGGQVVLGDTDNVETNLQILNNNNVFTYHFDSTDLIDTTNTTATIDTANERIDF